MSGGEQAPRRRLVVLWLLFSLGALLATAATLFALSSTVYSASAFVSRYFSLVASDNVAELLAMPGVAIDETGPAAEQLPEGTSRALLRSGLATATPTQVAITAETVGSSGSRDIEVSYRLAGVAHTAHYRVMPAPAVLGVIPRWRFVTSPLQVLSVTVQNGSHFSAATLTLDARAAELPGSTSTHPTGHYLVIAPAVLSLHYSSELVAAAPTEVTVLPDSENQATVTLLPTRALVDEVQSKLDGFLTECAKQPVLQPAGCPFGVTIDDRVIGTPEWKTVQTPVVTLVPGGDGFVMPDTPGLDHLTVPIQSLYDGSKSVYDEDVSYEVRLNVEILDDGTVAIQLH